MNVSLKEYERKQVKIILNNSYNFNGVVKKVDEDSLVLVDKFGLLVTIKTSDISLITERPKEVKVNDKKS